MEPEKTQLAGGGGVREAEVQMTRFCRVGVLEVVKKRQEEWKGRLDEMDNERHTRRVFEGFVERKKAQRKT